MCEGKACGRLLLGFQTLIALHLISNRRMQKEVYLVQLLVLHLPRSQSAGGSEDAAACELRLKTLCS